VPAVAVITEPEPFVLRSEERRFVIEKFVEVALASVVLPETVSVPVAVRFAELRLPLKKPLPATESLA